MAASGLGIALADAPSMRRVALLLPVALAGACTYDARHVGGDDLPGDDTTEVPRYLDCADARLQGEATSGVYTIDPDGLGAFDVYCDMETDEGGWTLALKVDGGLGTFAYDSPLWAGDDVYNPEFPDHDGVEAKLASFSRVASDHVMIETASAKVWINPGGQEPLVGHVNGSSELAAPVGMPAWSALVPGTDLPDCVWFEGTNLGDEDYSARIGLVAFGEDQEGCRSSLDAAIGVGLETDETCDSGPGGPGPETVGSAGTIHDGCAVPVFAYVYVRDWP
jgi:hypothetical protein